MQKLQEGTVPWARSWVIGLPQNFISKRLYSGLNFLSLCVNNYPSPYYVTYLQCKEKGGNIIKASKGSLIVFWKIIHNPDNKSEPEKYPAQVPLVRYNYVFNLTQTSLYKPGMGGMKLKSCEEILDVMNDKPVIRHNSLRCCYYPVEDYISLPVPADFNTIDEYYSSLFHELVHWTGNVKRLARTCNIADPVEKAGEEITAELASAFLCGLCGISSGVIDNQASYIDDWLSSVRDEPMLFVKAAAAANKAVHYILNTL